MICDNLRTIQQQIETVANSCGRNPQSIKLIAVSKRKNADAVIEASQCGQNIFGENYLQEAKDKIISLNENIAWHFIGHLQSNKAKQAVQLFQMVETVDRLKIAKALSKHCIALEKNLDILIQVNIGRESQKSGVLPEKASQLLGKINQLPNIFVKGLMTMPPFTTKPENSRIFFKDLRLLADNLVKSNLLGIHGPVELSMGMSKDFTIAIEEGATLIRVGTAIFGSR